MQSSSNQLFEGLGIYRHVWFLDHGYIRLFLAIKRDLCDRANNSSRRVLILLDFCNLFDLFVNLENNV